MSWQLGGDHNLPKISASAVSQFKPVKSDTVKDQVVLAATNTDHPLGITIASTASPGDPVGVKNKGVYRAKAAASIGAGGEVGVASTNGDLGAVVAASGFRRFAVGIAQENAAAGTTFSVLIRIRELPGL